MRFCGYVFTSDTDEQGRPEFDPYILDRCTDRDAATRFAIREGFSRFWVAEMQKLTRRVGDKVTVVYVIAEIQAHTHSVQVVPA